MAGSLRDASLRVRAAIASLPERGEGSALLLAGFGWLQAPPGQPGLLIPASVLFFPVLTWHFGCEKTQGHVSGFKKVNTESMLRNGM